jgi:sugar/nucleoside kinase (ribokinase family)
MTPDLVLLGNLLVDDVVFADGRTRMGQPGGAMLYAALAASLWGVRTGCVSLLGDDYPGAALDALRARGVAVDGIHPLHRNGVRTWLLYEDRVRRVIHRLGCPTHEAVSPHPEHIPLSWRTARAFHLAPMPFEVQETLVNAIRSWESPARPAHVSLDPHLPVTPQTLDRYRSLLAGVDVFFPSDDELQLDPRDPAEPGPRGAATEFDPAETLRSLFSGRLRFIALKRGARGGMLFDVRDRRRQNWPAYAERVVDPTGAGDAFMAGFVSSQLESDAVERALRRGLVTSSFAIEAWGPDGLLAATREAAETRLAAWYGSEVRS